MRQLPPGTDSDSEPSPTQRLNIVVSAPTFLPLVGGAELGIHEIYNRIGERHDVTIITPRLPQKLVETDGADGYPATTYRVVHVVSRIEGLPLRAVASVLRKSSLPYAIELWRLGRRRRIDIINFHYIAPHGMALILAGRLGAIQTVLSLVGRSDVVQSLGLAKRRYAEHVLAAADAVLPISAIYLRDALMPLDAEVVPYGVNVSQYAPSRASGELRSSLGIDDDQIMLICVQRLAKIKRVDLLISALSHVVERHPETVLVIVGQGSEEASLRALAHELRLDAQVRFCGYVDGDQLPKYFASADVFVFQSMFETFGIVFAQAMASGLPIIAASTSCVPDVVHTNNGILVESGDTVAFADAVCELIEDPPRRKRIGATNRARAENEFNWDSIALRYEAVFKQLLAG